MANRPRTGDVSVRLAAKRRRLLRRRVLLVAGAVVAAIAVGVVVWVVYLSAAFAVTTVTVKGISVLTNEEVIAAAQVPLGTPLARLDKAAVTKRVKQLKAVADVSVTSSLPHTVVISVKERTAVYAVSSGSGFDLVDASGIPYTSVAEVPEGLLVATVAGDNERVRKDVAAVVASFPAALRDRAVLISARTPDSITIELSGGGEVVWGSAENSTQKAEVISALLSVKANVYDVSSPSHPTTKG